MIGILYTVPSMLYSSAMATHIVCVIWCIVYAV